MSSLSTASNRTCCAAGIKKKAKVDNDQPLAIPVDIDNEEAALLGAMLVRFISSFVCSTMVGNVDQQGSHTW